MKATITRLTVIAIITSLASHAQTTRLQCKGGYFYLEKMSQSDWAVAENQSLGATVGGNIWELESVGNSHYRIMSGSKALTGGTSNDWDAVKTVGYQGWSSQKWRMIDQGNGWYKLVNQKNGKLLTGSYTNGGQVSMVVDSGWSTQLWRMQTVNTTGWPVATYEWIFEGITRTWNVSPPRDSTLIVSCTLNSLDHRAITIDGLDDIAIYQTSINGVEADAGILIRNASDVEVVDCLLQDQVRPEPSHSAFIRIEDSTRVTISGCEIARAEGNGIYNHGTADLIIEDCEIYDTGLYPYSDSAPFHGIYSKSADATIEGNVIYDAQDGSGISMRTTGTISGNTVYNTKATAIAYWPMSDPGPSNRLDILNNIVWQDAYTTDLSWPSSACIGVFDSGNKPDSVYFDHFRIEGNTCTMAATTSTEAMISVTVLQPLGYSLIEIIDNHLTDERSTENHLDNTHHMTVLSGNILD